MTEASAWDNPRWPPAPRPNNMHELSIAMSIVELAQEEMEKRGVRVIAVCLKLGPLAGVVKDALLSSYEMACFETPLQGTRLEIEEVPVIIFCTTCKAERPITSIQMCTCSECGTPAFEIIQGKELEVVALEIE